MAKPQRESSVSRDKLVGMTVIDGKGNLVGTVKDIGFTVGKAGISLSVETKAGEVQEISWDEIQGAGDFVVLKPPAQPTCPTCKGPLSYVQQYQRWYCYKCQKYV